MEFTKDELVLCQVLRTIIKVRERASAWYYSHLERAKAQRKKAYQRDQESARKNAREWYHNNTKQANENSLRNARENVGRENSRKLQWAKDHPEKRHAANRKWVDANPEKRRASSHRRRTLLRGSSGTWSAAEWVALKQSFGNICLCCRKTEDELSQLNRELIPDHVIPLSKGGLNDITNLQPLCHSWKKGSTGGCNNIKNDHVCDYRFTRSNEEAP
jgi:hypothetical protein